MWPIMTYNRDGRPKDGALEVFLSPQACTERVILCSCPVMPMSNVWTQRFPFVALNQFAGKPHSCSTILNIVLVVECLEQSFGAILVYFNGTFLCSHLTLFVPYSSAESPRGNISVFGSNLHFLLTRTRRKWQQLMKTMMIIHNSFWHFTQFQESAICKLYDKPGSYRYWF